MPLDSIAVVAGELVVEVVVSLTHGDESGNDVITRTVAVVERLVSEVVGERVDAEGGLLNDEDAENTGVNESTVPITPTKTSNHGGKQEAHEHNNVEVVLVLPNDNGVLVEIRNVGTSDTLGVLLHDHPAEMRVQKSLANGIGILVGVGVSVVSAMIARPPTD